MLYNYLIQAEMKAVFESMRLSVLSRLKAHFSSINNATGRLPVAAVTADKATMLSRTGQLVGVISMVDGKLTPIFVDSLVCQMANGASLASRVLSSINMILAPEKRTSQITGLAFDG